MTINAFCGIIANVVESQPHVAGVAQSVVQLIRNQQVVCSSHITSSNTKGRHRRPFVLELLTLDDEHRPREARDQFAHKRLWLYGSIGANLCSSHITGSKKGRRSIGSPAFFCSSCYARRTHLDTKCPIQFAHSGFRLKMNIGANLCSESQKSPQDHTLRG